MREKNHSLNALFSSLLGSPMSEFSETNRESKLEIDLVVYLIINAAKGAKQIVQYHATPEAD